VTPPGHDGWVEIFVEDPQQLFQSFDPSPFYERELDDRADEYIVQSARELPQQRARGVVIYVDRPAVSEDDRATIATAVRRHFDRRATAARWEMKQHFRRARATLAIALPVLAAAVIGSEVTGQLLADKPLHHVVRESLLIGGWVAMWQPLELLLYEWWPIRDRRRLYERLSVTEVRILPIASDPERAERARSRQQMSAGSPSA
jgi:hypothetical protein